MAMLTVLKLDFCQSNYCYLIFTTVLPTPRETLTGLPEKTTYLRYRPSPPGVTNGAYKLCKRYLYSCEFNIKFNQHLQNCAKVPDKFVWVQFYAGMAIATTGPFLTYFSTIAPPSTNAKRSPTPHNSQKNLSHL